MKWYEIQPKYDVILVAGGIFLVTYIAHGYRQDMNDEHTHQETYACNQPMTYMTQVSTVSGSHPYGFDSNQIQVPSADNSGFKIFWY